MSETEVAAETTLEPCPAACGDSGSVQVEMHDTLGAIALAIVSVLLLRALLKEQARNRALTERLVLLQGQGDLRSPGSTHIPFTRKGDEPYAIRTHQRKEPLGSTEGQYGKQ